MKYTRCYFPMFVVTIFFLQILALAKEGRQSMDNEEILLYDFKNPNRTEDWRIVNDGVMGGLSQSEIVYSDSNTAIFRGTVSLENNGGFASTRTKPRSFDLHGYDGIQIRAKGDGKTYQFRLRTNDSFDGISYRYLFETEVNVWKTIKLPSLSLYLFFVVKFLTR